MNSLTCNEVFTKLGALRLRLWLRSAREFSSVMDLPQNAPRLSAIVRARPVPLKLVTLNVIPNHSLFACLASDNCIPAEDHLSIFELSGEIEVTP